ncbi:unnamed protein product [marine sediment metagenome]|uniref:Uncharacterized protein n=1 Tax=marine sediment metagenome TaxID=412755 RepID=X0ZS68_9ZZZZ
MSPPFKSISFILEFENEGYNLSTLSSSVLVYKEQFTRNKEIPITQISITGI